MRTTRSPLASSVLALGLLLARPALADGPTEPPRLVGTLTEQGVFEATLQAPEGERGSIGPVVTVEFHDLLLEDAVGMAPPEATVVRVFGFDAVTGERIALETRLPEIPPVPVKEPLQPYSAPADNPGPAQGALSGKAIYLSQCHGWIWSETLGRFATQRGNIHETVEDMHNPEGMNQYLTAYLENAGAQVFTVKERDIQPETAIVDNDGGGAGYTETGSGFETYLDGFAIAGSYAYGVDPFDAGTTRRFPADGGGVATWTPTVPADGYYNVYVSWDSDPANATDAHYRITHPGGVIDRTYDQTVHGSTWQYVEKLWLTAGTGSLTVELVGDSSQAGAWLSADAVRIGGGMGVIARNGQTTGRPRWEGGGIQGAQYLGAPSSVYDPFNQDNDGSDPTSRPRWAAWEHPSGEDAVYVSWHSNAFNGAARGTNVFYHDSGGVTGSGSLATEVQTSIMDQITGRWDAGWQDRGVDQANFSEVNPSNNSEMPAILIELAFHDNVDDAFHLKHPKFRRDTSRGMLQGIIRYFADRDGLTAVFPPESPVGVQAVHEPGGGVRLSWQPGPSGSLDGDAPTGYLVYTSEDGRSWDNGFAVTGTTTVVNPPYESRFFRVVATNDGGQSFPSEVFGVRQSPDGFAPVLVVGAFDRFDVGLLGGEDVTNLGYIRRFDVRATNASDIIVPLGRAIGDADWFYDSASDEALSNIDLSAYDVVVWATGEESTVDETVSDAQQATLQAYVDGGGVVITSGAELLWDLHSQGSPSDQAFAEGVLGASFAADAASSTQVSGADVLAGLSVDFGNGRYPVEFPDVLAPVGTTVVATYGGGEVAGVIGPSGATFGFPLDAIGDDSQRAAWMEGLLEALAPQIQPPDPPDPDPDPIDTGDPVETDTDDPIDTDTPVDTDGSGVNTRRVPLTSLGNGCGCAPSSSAPTGPVLLVLGLVGVLARRRR